MDNFSLNMAVGALGAAVLYLTVGLVRVLPRLRLRLGTRIRNVYRRAIGMEHFEQLVIDDLRIYRADVDRLTRDTNGGIRAQAHKLSMHGDALQARNSRLNRIKREVEELGLLLHQYTEALGPMWQTAQGHRMPLRLLSTPHLRNIRDGGFGNYEVNDFIDSELRRRSIDAGFRADEAAGKKAPTKQEMIELRFGTSERKIAPFVRKTETGRILSLSPDDQNRVNQFSPIWARTLITELRTGRIKRLDLETRTRVTRVLPLWTQDIINGLLRRANR